ncbi:reverse transcriptase domain-containing protein [Tanacetum coccineum]
MVTVAIFVEPLLSPPSILPESSPTLTSGANEELSDGGSPRVIVYGYDGLPMQPVAPPSPDYVPGPEHPPSPDYVPGPEHPPSPAEEDPEEDPEEDHADYPADGRDDDDEPFDDDDDDTDDEDEEPFEDEDDDEEEEHLAPADSVIAPTVDYVPSSEETEPFETDESAATPPSPPTHRTTARISIRPEAPMPFPSEEEVERLLALPPPPPSPLISLSPPSAEERLARCLAAPALPSSPLPIVPYPYGSPNHVVHPRASEYMVSLFIPPPVDRGEDIPEADYGIRDIWVDPREAVKELAPTTLEGVNARVTELAAVQEQDTQDIYAVIEDTQDRQTQLFQRVDGLAYRTHTQMQDYRIASQESLTAALITQVSSLQGHLATALGEIRALQARDQARADAPEGTASTAVGLVFSFLVSDNHNNMPPRRSSATARAAAAAAPMTAAAVEQLIEARVSVALANHETLRNSTNGQGDGSHNSSIGNKGTTRTPHVAYAMDWKTLKKMMTAKYCPRGEIKKLEIKLWNIKVKGTDIPSYTMRFQELALMCGCMFPEESDEVEKYVGGLPDMIRGNVMSYRP